MSDRRLSLVPRVPRPRALAPRPGLGIAGITFWLAALLVLGIGWWSILRAVWERL